MNYRSFPVTISSCSLEGLIIADGGITCPADAAKALAAGATAVMMGGAFAGCDETPIVHQFEFDDNYKEVELSPIVYPKKVKFRGMASKEAQMDFTGDWTYNEGAAVEVFERGTAKDVYKEYEGGIRSTLSYVGVKTIKELQRHASFVEVTSNTVKRNGVHFNNP